MLNSLMTTPFPPTVATYLHALLPLFDTVEAAA